MKIVHIIEATATGTLAMAALLANSQCEKHSVQVVYSLRPESPKNIADHFDPRVGLICIPMHRPKEQFRALFSLRLHLRAVSPDVIFMHSSVAGFLGRLSLIQSSVPARLFYIPHCISFMRQDINGFVRRIFVFLERFANLKSATYVACSRSELNALAIHLPHATRTLVENAAVMPETDAARRWIDRRSALGHSIITVGHIRTQKNPLQFASIAREVLRQRPDVRFIWVGDGEPALRKALVDAGVEVTGWLSRIEVINHLVDSTIYLSTSRWEGLPVSLLEAIAIPLLPIASSCAGNIDVISPGETGYLFHSETEAVAHISEALTNDDLSSRLAENAKMDFSARFTVDAYTRQMATLIEPAPVSTLAPR